mgnify:FL=1
MKYIKNFESYDEDMINSLKQLSYQMSRFKTLLKMDIRHKTPKEIYEDYFLEFRESENFRVKISGNNHRVGPITIYLDNMLDKNTIESEFYRYVEKLKSIKKRLVNDFNFNCHFTIKLNGKIQVKQHGFDRQNDEYPFLGIGDDKYGYDSKFYYTNDKNIIGSNLKDFPNDKVAIRIIFYII